MLRSLHTAATGMKSQQLHLDVIANNISNVNTTAFKKNRVDFQDLMYQILKVKDNQDNGDIKNVSSIAVGTGTRVSSTEKMFSQGDVYETDNPLDLMIEGDGFFQVEREDGSIAYTRDGTFHLSGDGYIVNANGYVLYPGFQIPDDAVDISITRDGSVLVLRNGYDEYEEIGKITLVRFLNPAGLRAIGDNLYEATPAAGVPIESDPQTEGLGSIKQGFLEMSNVDIAEEMIQMIIAQRSYELNIKVVKASDDMLSMISSIRR